MLNACAWAVHAYTALGAVAGLFAIHYAAQGDFRASFIAMGAAMVIDCSDGPLARVFEVRQRVPIFDGALLDNLVDYLNYVVAPIFLMLRAGLLATGAAGLTVASLAMLASAYGFCRTDAKTADHYFLGFPSYWNVVALYQFCFGLSPPLNSLIVAGFAAMVFVPIKYIYPNRTPSLRRLTLTLGIIWAVATIVLLFALPAPNRLLLAASFAFVIYYFMASFFLHGRALLRRSHGGPSQGADNQHVGNSPQW